MSPPVTWPSFTGSLAAQMTRPGSVLTQHFLIYKASRSKIFFFHELLTSHPSSRKPQSHSSFCDKCMIFLLPLFVNLHTCASEAKMWAVNIEQMGVCLFFKPSLQIAHHTALSCKIVKANQALICSSEKKEFFLTFPCSLPKSKDAWDKAKNRPSQLLVT